MKKPIIVMNTMKKLNLTGKQLRAIGYPEGPVISIAINLMKKYYKFETEENALNILKDILTTPENYKEHETLGFIAKQLLPPSEIAENGSEVALNKTGVPFQIFGKEHIEEDALFQIQNASKLPIAVSGALMPDAHPGYGLPIGGVLATQNAIIPYGVGVDIGCRMCLSIFDINPIELDQKIPFYSRELNEATLFGTGKQFESFTDHEILDRKEFDEIEMLRSLKDRAAYQLGTSGSGNHFVEFGIVDIKEEDPILKVSPGKYVGLLSHSGSRGLGATIANHYTRLAKEKIKLPGEAANLAWLNLDEEDGIEYWLAMNLAGDYASANHHMIHAKIARQLGREPIRMVENHHNFAWKEKHDGKEVIVHRKGATPAGKNVLGIIPGSMTAPGFIVKGKGEIASLSSAAHGAGRQLSRSAALKTITRESLNDILKKHGVTLIGGGLDEAPFAYKDIHQVMQSQESLIEVVGKFSPKIVKMDSSSGKRKRGRK
ncbi:MAG: RtcB family protein [Ginsengibacter sp.]